MASVVLDVKVAVADNHAHNAPCRFKNGFGQGANGKQQDVDYGFRVDQVSFRETGRSPHMFVWLSKYGVLTLQLSKLF